MPTAPVPDVLIRRWTEIAGADRFVRALDAVFFESSLTKTFADESARRAFRERWLGRYLEHDPAFAYLALDGERVAGYLVGSIDDTATTPRFRDVAVAKFAKMTTKYPAHLHVNLAPQYRNQGLGGRLIAAFVSELTRAKVAGVHVITNSDARNVAFYRRNGFGELARAKFGTQEVILLGRSLR